MKVKHSKLYELSNSQNIIIAHAVKRAALMKVYTFLVFCEGIK